jgi:hypothetical protein
VLQSRGKPKKDPTRLSKAVSRALRVGHGAYFSGNFEGTDCLRVFFFRFTNPRAKPDGVLRPRPRLFAPICLSRRPIIRQSRASWFFLSLIRRFGTGGFDARACPPPRAAPGKDAHGPSEPDVAPSGGLPKREGNRVGHRASLAGEEGVGIYNDFLLDWRSLTRRSVRSGECG